MTQHVPAPEEPADEPPAREWGSMFRIVGMHVWHTVREFGIVVVTALVLSVLLRTFVFQLFYVPSESMLDTLQVGDKIVASKVTMTFQGVNRGDVIVFHDPGDWLYAPVAQEGWRGTLTKALTEVGFLPSNSGEDLVKRVVGVAGDHIVCCAPGGRITVNGHVLNESAYTLGTSDQVNFDITVPKDRVFVMGDNRANSRDSRFHLDVEHGTVPLSEVRGIVVLKLWPMEHFGPVPAPSTLIDANK